VPAFPTRRYQCREKRWWAQLRIANRRPEQPILNILVIGQQCSPDRLRMRAGEWGTRGRHPKGVAMPAFDPQLTHVMRKVLEDTMISVPVEYSTPAVKARLAECILKAAAEGHTTYNEMVTAAGDQIQAILSILT
jgi:hypothetical protein